MLVALFHIYLLPRTCVWSFLVITIIVVIVAVVVVVVVVLATTGVVVNKTFLFI